MRGYLKSFLLLCLIWNTTVALAADGCNATTKCLTDDYCDIGGTNTCKKCSDATDGKYPLADNAGTNFADSIAKCYDICTTKIIDFGTLATNPANKKVYYSQTCSYTNLNCVDGAIPNQTNTLCQCDANYTGNADKTECTGKCYKLTLYRKLSTTDGALKTLYVKYGDGFYTGANCTGTKLTSNADYTQFVQAGTAWWYDFKGYAENDVLRFGNDGAPTNGTNNKTFTGNTSLNAQWGTKNYIINYFDSTGAIKLVDAPQTCALNSDISNPFSGVKCPAASVQSFDTGQTIIGWSKTIGADTTDYRFNENIQPEQSSQTINLYAVMGPCPAGYYCTTIGYRQCPTGATSDTGATKIGDCYISNKTQFRDKNGTFTLPIPTINYTL